MSLIAVPSEIGLGKGQKIFSPLTLEWGVGSGFADSANPDPTLYSSFQVFCECPALLGSLIANPWEEIGVKQDVKKGHRRGT